MIHQLERQQQLNCDLETAWKFFSSANNLSEITPKDMNFVVRTQLSEDEIYEGMVIDYYVSPLFGIKLKWQTIIVEVESNKMFTDFQNKGPFKMWHHHHFFIPNEDGVLMVDKVNYELPFGFLGEFAHKIMVKKKLENIFDFRFDFLEKKFNKK
ncbi:SRPBCC family protein [Chryseobacterium formosus]|uniref:SRPBCC family protein n=1 Tax=Chryseobacterium formosus TaxID=1537363 RepID=A0ABT3XT89_9FLAO|nr:SRPBCC family protein [Chryseobacterium formosus]MCX8524986.1 SRPBCC family protein [Chryseobacterium formosus]